MGLKGGGEIAQLVTANPGDRGINPVTAISLSCAAIHFLVIKGQLLSYHACMVWDVTDTLSR